MENILKNCWYPASWSEDLTIGQLLAIQLLGKNIVLFRRQDGVVQAILDRCPHRFAPLSMGKIVGDDIQCTYHGLCYNGKGKCTVTPSGEKIVEANKVPYFAIVERYDVFWIWGGIAEDADESLIPELPFLESTKGNKVLRGVTHVKGDYQLGSDNLMDLTHPQFLHGQSFGDNSQSNAEITVTQEGDHVVMEYYLAGDPTPAGFNPYFRTNDTIVNTWLTIRWQPAAILVLEVRIALLEQNKNEGKYFLLSNLMAPETKDSYRYLWAASRTDDLNNKDIDQLLLGLLKMAFDHEDAPIIEACHERMDGKSLFDMKPVLLKADQGAVRVRRLLAKLISDELNE